MIMNGWYSASQEIVFAIGARGAMGGFFSPIRLVW
jgi:hypothetical protein